MLDSRLCILKRMDDSFYIRPGYLVQRAARVAQRVADGMLQPAGIRAGQMPVLGALRDGTALTQAELAKRVAVEQPTMAQLLARMERDGLVQRRPDPKDGRRSLITLTPLARRRMPQAREILLRGGETALAGFTSEEAETLSRLLQKMIGNLEAALEQEP